MCIVQEVEGQWSRLGTGEKIPLLKAAFSMTIKGITRSIFGATFDDQTRVDKLTKAYVGAWDEMEVYTYDLDEVVFGLVSIVAFFLQKRIKEGVDPPEGNERDTAFKKNCGFMKDLAKAVIAQRREGGGEEHIPFIDNLLQSGVPDDQVREMIMTHMYIHRCEVASVPGLPRSISGR